MPGPEELDCPMDPRHNKYPDNNPKQAIGITKAPTHFVPPALLIETGLAMADGGEKYGPYNWRDSQINASVYYDAMMRHLMAWWDGEDHAEDSGVHHLGHVAACCALILDSEAVGTFGDDRPAHGVTSMLLGMAKRRMAEVQEEPRVVVNLLDAGEDVSQTAWTDHTQPVPTKQYPILVRTLCDGGFDDVVPYKVYRACYDAGDYYIEADDGSGDEYYMLKHEVEVVCN